MPDAALEAFEQFTTILGRSAHFQIVSGDLLELLDFYIFFLPDV